MAQEPYLPVRLSRYPDSKCYICKQPPSGDFATDVGAILHSREAALKIIDLYAQFGLYAELEKITPTAPLVVKLGACDEHRKNLEKLVELCQRHESIDASIIVKSLIE